MPDKRLLKEVIKNRMYLTAMSVYGVFLFFFSFLTAFFISDIVNLIFIKKEKLSETYIMFLYLSLVLVLKTIFIFFVERYFKMTAASLKNKILVKAMDDMLKQGPVLTKGQASGGIVTSWSEAADHIEPFYGEYLPQFFSLMITVPLLLVTAFAYDFISACIMLVTGPLLPFFLSLIGIQSKEANKKRLAGLAELGDSMLDFLSGIRTLKLFNGEKEYRNVIIKNSEAFRERTMQVLKIAFLSAFVLEFAATISTAMIAVSLGIRLLYEKNDFRTAFFILLLTPDYYMAIRKFGAKFHTAMGAKAAADVLYKNSQIEEPGNVINKSEVSNKNEISDKRDSCDVKETGTEFPFDKNSSIDIQLKNITFQYKENNVNALNNLSMKIEHNNITAIVGKSGAGKSTLAYLLMRFINSSGELYFNQLEVSLIHPKLIRELIAYIPQKPHIFHDTLRNNLLHARKGATNGDIESALEKASLKEFAEALPEGLDTVLTEVGTNISVGEAQRLAFARAYLKDCPIIIMDEITSALDQENEKLLEQTFTSLAKNKTVLIIAHRLETVKKSDVIYILDKGSIIETGNHESLLSGNGIYKELVDVWEGTN